MPATQRLAQRGIQNEQIKSKSEIVLATRLLDNTGTQTGSHLSKSYSC